MTGIELFLTTRFYAQEEHPRGWSKYVYDNENIHYAMLKILTAASRGFTQALLRLPAAPARAALQLEPERGLFDLLILADEVRHYVEIKTWTYLEKGQLGKQTAFLRERDARGLYLLLTKLSADGWSPTALAEESDGRSRVVGAKDLLVMLEAVEPSLPHEILEAADAYRTVLTHVQTR